MPDKFKALWLSHSSINDFMRCPRLYYLNNMYKNPATNRKISIMNPHLALGQAVHDVLESLSELPAEKRLEIPLKVLFEVKWRKVSGEMGGFSDDNQELEFKNRGINMLKSVEAKPGPILEKAIKIKEELPWYWLSEDEEMILCGKIDWLKYNEQDNSVDIIDFKTGKNEESGESLQLAIYRLLVESCQSRRVNKASYWYLDQEKIVDHRLPDSDESKRRVLEVARNIKQARQNRELKCPKGGCYACTDMEKIIEGKAKFAGVGSYNKEIYVLK